MSANIATVKGSAKSGHKSPETKNTAETKSSTVQSLAAVSSKAPRKQKAPMLLLDSLSTNFHSRVPADKSCVNPLLLFEQLRVSEVEPSILKRATSRCRNHSVIPEELTTVSSHGSESLAPRTEISKLSTYGQTLTLDHFSATNALETLIVKYGRISHMGILDASYTFFLNKARDAALYYKVANKVAVVGGDPLCAKEKWDTLLQEFAVFRKKPALGIAFLGAAQEFRDHAMKQKGYVSMCFGIERALDPTCNAVVLEKESKRLVKQNRQLLDPVRGGMKVHVYVAAAGRDFELEAELISVYEEWRANHNQNGKQQAYITVLEPFALPSLMVYIYTTDNTGRPNGFAGLRRIDSMGGYHLDPYCARPDAPKGMSDLLIYCCLVILNRAGVKYLGLGFEPRAELTEIQGLSKTMTGILKSAYRKSTARLPIEGKRAFNGKWCPEPTYDAEVYIIYPCKPDLHHSLATMHFANVSARDIMKAELKQAFLNIKASVKKDQASDTESHSSGHASDRSLSRVQSKRSLKPYNLQQGLVSASKLPVQVGIHYEVA